MDPIYLDNAATTPLCPEVQAALAPFLAGEFGNPSSRYPLGVRAADALDRARRQVARATGVEPVAVTFTGSGTEANNLGVLGAARRRDPGRVLIGATEHPSVREAALALAREGYTVEALPLDGTGGLDLDAAAELLDERVVLVAQMMVNNEFGTRYPVEALASLARARAPRAHVHVDAVQALGKLELSLEELGVDSLALSAHKVHAPKGAGALVCRRGVELVPLLYGGGQERGRRPGTENVPGIVAFGEAARLADENVRAFSESARVACAALEAGLAELPGARRIRAGEPVDAVCAIALPGAPAEVWQHHLEARGVFTSVGSACQSLTKDVSPALRALGMDERQARQVMRFSFSRATTLDEVQRATRVLREVAEELAGVRP
jgi:cysteine desulfurase